MFERKELKARVKKKFEQISEDQEIIFSIKRKLGDQSYDNIYLLNDEEMLRFINSRKQQKLNFDDVINQTKNLSLDDNTQKIVVLEKLYSDDTPQYNEETQQQSILKDRREQFVDKFRRDIRDKMLQEKRNKFIIELEQDKGNLRCCDQQQNEQLEKDYYVMKQVNKNEMNQEKKKSALMNIDAKQIEKYFDNYYVDSEHNSSIDSEDSQRTDQDAYEYPENESSDDEDVEVDDDYYDNNSDDSQKYKKYRRKDIQEKDDQIEIDEQQQAQGIEINQVQAFMSFIKQHEQLKQEKQCWKTFDYENDF
ncbi:unnamed protein product (macronuclear) [Paramecium tetraurelia]|uniref:CCD97-like C-terminal domain-containing protein n=1 Tax=Paramecium tetraurelia TaxID=5888 RepID=A0DS43_PARTE|nr:uncharacterized protein GSPATT00019564001 [Paramecium tetraurelia]CAK85860.1 unnamed protein product [Paramecium tetraurelia]|eukprot:XP_001453257.1 hypothetical protein (macronuclear) [Paramecium tetraurelia strain d4-2]